MRKSRRKLKNTLKQMIMKTHNSKSMGCHKAVLRWNFIAIQTFLKKEEKSQINNVTQHPNELEKEQTKPWVSRRREIIKIKEEIKVEIKKTIEEINNVKSSFFEKGNTIDKPLARLTKKRRDKTQIKSEMKRDKSQRILQKYKKPWEYTMNNCMPTNFTT